MHDLSRLDLSDTDVTGAGLVNLNGLTNLRRLDLGHGVTDAGLVQLKGLAHYAISTSLVIGSRMPGWRI